MSSNEQKIGLVTATIIGMNAMIGAGIFSAPAALSAQVGPAGILTYALVIIAVWFMANSIARVAELYPEEGSFYAYTKHWGGHTLGLIAAGSYLIGLVIAMGLLAQMAGFYLHSYFPLFSAQQWGMFSLSSLVLLNMLGVSLSELGQKILICCTIFPLLVTIIICFAKSDINNLFPFMPYGIGNVLAATKAVIFGFFGFECAASLFTIVKDPEKNVSKALTYAIVLVGILYLLFVTSLIMAVPLHYFSDPSIPLSETLQVIFPHHWILITSIHFSILSAIIGTIHSMIWSSSTLLISYFKQFKNPTIKRFIDSGTINHRMAVLLIGTLITLTYFGLHDIDLFFSLTALFIVFAYATSMITLLTLKNEWKSKKNIKVIIGLLTAGLIFYFAAEGLIIELFKKF